MLSLCRPNTEHENNLNFNYSRSLLSSPRVQSESKQEEEEREQKAFIDSGISLIRSAVRKVYVYFSLFDNRKNLLLFHSRLLFLS